MSSEKISSREQYMNELRHELRRLPKEDFDAACAYFEEYFDEAGEKNEIQAMEDLGSPRQAARELIVSLAVKNSREPAKTDVKKGFSSVWVGILAVFAAPIALPLAFAAVLVVASLGLALFLVLLSVGLCGAAAVLCGILSVVSGGIYLFQSPGDALSNIGMGLMCLGAGVVLLPAVYDLSRKVLKGLIGLFGKLVKKFAKGGQSPEEK